MTYMLSAFAYIKVNNNTLLGAYQKNEELQKMCILVHACIKFYYEYASKMGGM
mgnify:CR=1 FL=1